MSKAKRKYAAIQTMEDGIKAYLFINALMDTVEDSEHPHAPLARFVMKATLNELLDVYMQKNGEAALQAFADKINQGAANEADSESRDTV
jgi:hypothetical protein